MSLSYDGETVLSTTCHQQGHPIPSPHYHLKIEIEQLYMHVFSCDIDLESRVVRKQAFAYAKTKTQISFAVTVRLISAFVFATRIVQSLYFLNQKFHAIFCGFSSQVCVGPGRKPPKTGFLTTRLIYLQHNLFYVLL